MFKNIVISAFGAGLAACVAVSALQFFTTGPLILEAERFESVGAVAPRGHDPVAATVAEIDSSKEARAPAEGIERALYTTLANLVIVVGVSLMLLGGIVLRGDPIDWRRGLLWGTGGFVAVSLLPSLGLPPELPGTPAAEIASRQAWWLGAAVASAAGIALIVFASRWPVRATGLALIFLPHLIGAPVPPSHAVAYPGALAGEFVAASLVVSALMWSMSGAAGGWLLRRLSRGA